MKRFPLFFAVLVFILSMTFAVVEAKGPEETFDFVDECNDLSMYWTEPINSESVFIISHDETFGIEGKSVPEGQYRFFGKSTSPTYNRMSVDLPTGCGSWTIEFSAKFSSLPTLVSLGDIAGWRGFNIIIHRSNGSAPAVGHIVGFTYGVIGVVGSSELFIGLDPSIVGLDKEFHVWRIVFNDKGNESVMTFFKDGEEVAQFTKVVGKAYDFPTEGKLLLQNVPLSINPYEGDLDVYLDYIAFRKDE